MIYCNLSDSWLGGKKVTGTPEDESFAVEKQSKGKTLLAIQLYHSTHTTGCNTEGKKVVPSVDLFHLNLT